MARLFGTDGVRGIANSELTATLAMNLGAAGACTLANRVHSPTILLGCDTRRSCDMLCCALAAGIMSVGGSVKMLGVIPTPALPYLTRLYKADAAVMVSASHNTMKYNGIKWFDGNGFKLSDAAEDRIEQLIKSEDSPLPVPIGEHIGSLVRVTRAREDYAAFLAGCAERSFAGVKVAIDCANGAASHIAPELFERLGAEVFAIANEPDGCNINANCGSTHIENLEKFVVETGADLGFAFDGDADRVLAVDERGKKVDGDKIMGICAKSMFLDGELVGNTLVATVMSNIGLVRSMRAAGINTLATDVGDRYVLERMRQDGYNFGGEQSGHIIFYDKNTSGDGMLTAIMLLNIITGAKKPLSALADDIATFPQTLVNVELEGQDLAKIMRDEELLKFADEIHRGFAGSGRVLLRKSGTEPRIRIMLEGADRDDIESKATDIANLIMSKYGGFIVK